MMKKKQYTNKEKIERQPKLLTVDIETSPLIAYSWGPKWKTNLIKVKEHSKILSFSAKWYGGKQITKILPDYPGYKAGVIDDKKLVEELHSLLDEADAVIVQNGRAFDIKVINTRVIAHGLKPPAPYKTIDTLSEAKKYLKLPSFSLNEMCKYFGIGSKLKHQGFSLWEACMAGDKKAWAKMKKYNAVDVQITEQLYNCLRPFMKTHPNFSTYSDTPSCDRCLSKHVQKRGFGRNSTTVYQRYQCMDCGGWFRQGKNLKKYENKRMNL